jgi:hypothetical protein
LFWLWDGIGVTGKGQSHQLKRLDLKQRPPTALARPAPAQHQQ